MSGWSVLLRVFLWRDRWHLCWWTLGVALLYVSQGISVDKLYTSQEDFDRAAASMERNTALIAMTGPARALNTTGGQVMWQAAAFGAITVGLMSMLLVARHTRAEEESGRDELVRAAAIGRFATLIAATGTVVLANVLVGTVAGLSLVAYGLPVLDSVAVGVGLLLCGVFFTGTALVAAQLTTSTRGMYGIAGGIIGLAYALRAIGDVSTPALSWLSPIGWYQSMHPYSGLRWWPSLLLILGALLALAGACVLFGRRDLGSGLWAARPGPAGAGRRLTSSFGLAWRLQRGSLLGWGLGLLLGGLAYGSIGDSAGDLVGDSHTSQEMFSAGSADLVDGFFAVALVLLALIATGFALSSISQPRSAEVGGHAEIVLASGISRQRWLAGQIAVCGIGTVLVVIAAAIGVGLGYALSTGDPGGFLRLALPMLAYVAPILVTAGVAILLYGVLPRAVAAAWAVLAYAAVVLLFGEVFQLPDVLRGLSPFDHLALVPAEGFRLAPLVGLLAVAAALTGLGAFAFSRRDIG